MKFLRNALKIITKIVAFFLSFYIVILFFFFCFDVDIEIKYGVKLREIIDQLNKKKVTKINSNLFLPKGVSSKVLNRNKTHLFSNVEVDCLGMREYSLLASVSADFSIYSGKSIVEDSPFKKNFKYEGFVLPRREKLQYSFVYLYFNPQEKKSHPLQRLLEKYSIDTFQYYFNEKGYRNTVNYTEEGEAQSQKKILVVGDSVAMGFGVGDDETIASYLAKEFKGKFFFVNAGVQSFDSKEISEVLKRESTKDYDSLVYVMCENDILDTFKSELLSIKELGGAYFEKFRKVVFIKTGHLWWGEETIDEKKELESFYEVFLNKGKFSYLNGDEIFSDYAMETNGSSKYKIARFFVDALHLSPDGAKLLSGRISKHLEY